MTISEKITHKDDGLYVELDGVAVIYGTRKGKEGCLVNSFKGRGISQCVCKAPPQNIKKLLDEGYEVVKIDCHAAKLTIYKNG